MFPYDLLDLLSVVDNRICLDQIKVHKRRSKIVLMSSFRSR